MKVIEDVTLVNVDLYKPSGKYYGGFKIYLSNLLTLSRLDMYDFIVKNQKEYRHIENFIMVVKNAKEKDVVKSFINFVFIPKNKEEE